MSTSFLQQMSSLALFVPVFRSTNPTTPSSNTSASVPHRLHLAEAVTCPLLSRDEINQLSPFQLRHPAHIREWYYLFKRNFSMESPVFDDYCNLSCDEFRLRFEGSPAQIEYAISIVEMQFHDCLRMLLADFVGSVVLLVRDYVEDVLMENLEKSEGKEVFSIQLTLRRNHLMKMAALGNFRPLLHHLLVYSATPEQIWQTFITSLTTWIPSPLVRVDDFADSIAEAKKAGPDISTQISWWYRNTKHLRKKFCPIPYALKYRSQNKNNRKKGVQNQKAQINNQEEYHQGKTKVHFVCRTMDVSNTREGHYAEPSHYLFYESMTGQGFLINPDDGLFGDEFSSDDDYFST
ncbi:hypothetical protein EJF18_40021 [Clavispora lusitaniae]|uniref:Uncharacterized protein n=2 Tax=Clavispora lusitaniae TaxID=36911 RepID=C4Y4Y1_CLAL4|nr:uncharacterized protein CLUG_03215 [Clavispora lusitaniae ATCC 42720]QFZ27999.1 hypothetical protein EJF14_40021 [Clavispora lusitaniae]EEQ39087.1 predicted protein [Clavispora lusitaniae ATCC 42720]QFZ33663.1 hypothetical protein EJF16_40021 [Clavispora lusitaniae]QFZ39334.1 hypothetical protein EJF15_40021 [Clavispora lusitaniae]QFZ45016.1 hypothetical protein EJF18_40021 [Clavispora lusitaniae]